MNDEEKLLAFLKNIDCLETLKKYNIGVNFFEITGMVNREIKHSKFLSWLFDPNGNHGLGDEIIKKYISGIINLNNYNADVFRILLLDYSSFIVKTEYKNIDLLLYSVKEKYVFAIENKVYATERASGDDGGQLSKYSKILDDDFSDYIKIKIFLTLDGYSSYQTDWLVSDYSVIAEILDEIIENNESISRDARLLLSQYTKILRRYLIVDEKLKEICEKIYKEHKEALDLIYQYKPDQVQVISNNIQEFLKQYDGKEIFLATNNKKTFIRFTTPYINDILPKIEDESFGWQNGYRFMYEIECGIFGIEVRGCISKPDDEICDKIYKLGQEQNKKYSIVKKTIKPQQWARTWKFRILKGEEVAEFDLDNSLDRLNEQLKKMLIRINEYENDIQELLQS